MQKLLIIFLALIANLCIMWFANKGAKITNAGTIFGWSYDSRVISSILLTFKFFWLLIITNAIFIYASKTGVETFSSYVTFILIWIAMAPIAAILFNFFVSKEPLNWIHFAGLILVFSGTALIYANKEISKIL